MADSEPVVIDAQVFLRIAKHAKQVFPSGASGTLMGIEEDRGLQVTSCFGYKRADPSAYAESADVVGAKQSFQYEVDMIKLLGDVNLDAQSVGWYMTTHHGNLFNEALVEHQYVFQSQVPTAVCVVYDSFKTQVGGSGFTAYRLTAAAMDQRMSGEADVFADFDSAKLFEEVPIKVYCSPYTEAFLLGSAAKAKKDTSDGITLMSKSESHEESAAGKGLDRNVALLLETVEEFTLQQRETQMYERAQRQNKMNANQRVPKSIDALNLTKQIQEHSANLDSYCVNTFAKLYLGGDGAKDATELEAMKNLMKN